MNAPRSTRELRQISAEFTEQWNFSYCIGTIDGKHIKIEAPTRSGSTYFNYKKTFSIVLEKKAMVKNLTTVHLELLLKTSY